MTSTSNWLAMMYFRRHLEALCAVVICVLILGYLFFPLLRRTYEDVMFALNPSAERAFLYGEVHFSSQHVRHYDVERANWYFERAAALDPTLPYVQHELARISFLKDHFRLALSQINFQISMHGDDTPNSYYVRGLIEGYMGKYDAAERDYAHFLEFDSHNWAALNDYAWVLLKGEKFAKALDVTEKALVLFPENPWLLNSYSIALFEEGRISEAYYAAQRAVLATSVVTEQQWLRAYPGNDPKIAADGVAVLRASSVNNLRKIELQHMPGAI